MQGSAMVIRPVERDEAVACELVAADRKRSLQDDVVAVSSLRGTKFTMSRSLFVVITIKGDLLWN
jgi:hypothetical protein